MWVPISLLVQPRSSVSVACLASLPWARLHGRQSSLTSSLSGILPSWAETSLLLTPTPHISEFWAQLQMSAVRMKTMSAISDIKCWQMFLSLAVTDVTSHHAPGMAVLGSAFHSWGGRRSEKEWLGTSEGFPNKVKCVHSRWRPLLMERPQKSACLDRRLHSFKACFTDA